jgi:hypothetical protein
MVSAVKPQFTNASHHEQIGSRTNFPKEKKTFRVTNGVSINEHASNNGWRQAEGMGGTASVAV